MDFLVIGLVAFSAPTLIFFLVFGVGTLLLPAFALAATGLDSVRSVRSLGRGLARNI